MLLRKPLVIAIFIFAPWSLNAAVSLKISAFPEGERLVYARLIEAFRHGQLNEVLLQRNLLERNYPLSSHLDGAYYLTGQLQLQNKRFAEALKAFNVFRDRFIKSSKRPAALFAMATIYQHLNLAAQAHRVFSNIMNEYPGSPESQRAWMQLQLEREHAGKKG